MNENKKQIRYQRGEDVAERKINEIYINSKV